MKTQLEGFLLETYTNSIGMETVLIPAGSFMMGSEAGYGNEEPVHEVTISKPFYLGKHEVAQEQWEVVMGNNPSTFNPDPSLGKLRRWGYGKDGHKGDRGIKIF